MFWGARGTVRRVAEPGRKVPGAVRPSRRADRPASIPGMRQAPDSPSVPGGLRRPPGSHRDPLQDWKTTAPRFSSFSAAPFPVVLFRGQPENVLALYSVSSGALPPQRLCGAANRTAPGGRFVTGATPLSRRLVRLDRLSLFRPCFRAVGRGSLPSEMIPAGRPGGGTARHGYGCCAPSRRSP